MAKKVWNFEISYTFVYTKVPKKSEIKKKNLNSDFNLNSHRPEKKEKIYNLILMYLIQHEKFTQLSTNQPSIVSAVLEII